MTAAFLCLLHCLGTPLLLVLPLMGVGLNDDSFHRPMAIIVTLPALFALVPGYLFHRRWQVPVIGAFGLMCFVAALLLVGPAYGETAEAALAVTGGLMLFAAHVANRRLCCRGQRCKVLRRTATRSGCARGIVSREVKYEDGAEPCAAL